MLYTKKQRQAMWLALLVSFGIGLLGLAGIGSRESAAFLGAGIAVAVLLWVERIR